jgi:hypothetical protein
MNTKIRCYLLVVLFVGAAVNFFSAAQSKEARVTAVIKDVRLLAHNAQPRAASLNDTVVEGSAVRTGGDSRAELTFSDQTLTRIGANSVFSFGAGGKEFDLASGAMLLAAPKSAGTLKVNTAAATAAVSGFTALFDSRGKTIVLEGEACVKPRARPNEPCIVLHAGDLLILNGNRIERQKINIDKIVRTAGLINNFKNKLPPWSIAPINTEITNQNTNGGGTQNPGGYYNDQTGSGAIDQRNNANPQPTPKPPQPSPPPSPPGL